MALNLARKNASMIVVRPNSGRDDYTGAMMVDVGDYIDATEFNWERDQHHVYLDTPYGSFRRSINYHYISPYGWEAVSWG